MLLDTLIQSVLERVLRNEMPPIRALETVGESEPRLAADALLDAASLPELAASRSSWIPALMVSARPGRGARLLSELARNYRAETGERLDPARLRSLALVLGSSELMGQLLLANPEWADDLAGDPPAPPDLTGSAPSWTAIREAKLRGLLVAVARELLGCPLQVSLAELSGLADACLETALGCAARETGVAPPVLFGLGQLGGSEIGISPEVDLLMVDGGAGKSAQGFRSRSAELELFVDYFRRKVEQEDAFGPLYRLVLDQRPGGIFAGSVAEAIDCLASSPSKTERQLLRRVRGMAGPGEVVGAFVRGLAGQRSRTSSGFAADADVGGVTMRRHEVSPADLVAGTGGIRDVEAIVQAQWATFGRSAMGEWGCRTILDGLAELREGGLIEADAGCRLADAYSWLRRAEHSLQLIGSDSPREFPGNPEGELALARCMGYREPDARIARDRLLRDRIEVRREVETQFDSVLRSCAGSAARPFA